MNNMFITEKIRSLFRQLIRYASVGIANNLVGYTVYLLVTYFGVPPKLTMTALYGIGVAIGYAGHRNLTFSHKGSVLGSGLRYVVAHCFGYLINLTILIIFVDRYGYPHQWIQAIAIFIVAGFLFIALRFFVFNHIDKSTIIKP